MRYVISDIHGCYKEYLDLLNKIHFSDEDYLYVLGDAGDRGPNPIEVLLDLAGRKNVTYVVGNHDLHLHYFIRKCGLDYSKLENDDDRWDYKFWQADGGLTTTDGYLMLSKPEKKIIFDFLDNANVYDELEYDGKRYIMVHGGIGNFDESLDLDDYDFTTFIFDRMDYSKRYYKNENTYIITGHTPTMSFRKDRKAEVYQENGHIAIDCGCVYGFRLAAYCIETGETFYVDSFNNRLGKEK